MVDPRKYFRIYRSVVRDLSLGKISMEQWYLFGVMLDRAQYDTATCVFSLSEAERILGKGYRRRKAANFLYDARKKSYISFTPVQGKHKFEVKLHIYNPASISAPPQKEHVFRIKEQVEEHVLENVPTGVQEDKRNRQRDMLEQTETKQNERKEKENKDETKDNEPLFFFDQLVPDEFVKKHGLENVRYKMEFLTFDYKDKPPLNPPGLLWKALENNWQPSDKFREYKKRQEYGPADLTRSGDGPSKLDPEIFNKLKQIEKKMQERNREGSSLDAKEDTDQEYSEDDPDSREGKGDATEDNGDKK